MHAGTFRSIATPTKKMPTRTSRYLMLAAVTATLALAGCASRTTQAPVTDMSGGAAAPATGSTYVVKAGDTLYKIAQAQNLSVAEISRLNNITDPSQLRIGQVLRLNSSVPAPAGSGTATATPLPVTPVEPVTPTATARASDAAVVSWDWPAPGKIIQSFNSNTKGIDIEGTVGDPVQAAADGKVMYAGNGVRGLGNLILLGHGNGFITAYAHNQSLLVKTGQEIKKGEKIATIGQSDTTSPRLHFEIRRKGTPVNPMSYLPAR